MHFRREGPAEPRLGPHQIWPKTPLRASLRSLSASGSLYTSPWCNATQTKADQKLLAPTVQPSPRNGCEKCGLGR